MSAYDGWGLPRRLYGLPGFGCHVIPDLVLR